MTKTAEKKGVLAIVFEQEEPASDLALEEIRDALVSAGATGVQELWSNDGWFVEGPVIALIETALAVSKELGWAPAVGLGLGETPGMARAFASFADDRAIVSDEETLEAAGDRISAHRGPGPLLFVDGLVDAADAAKVDWHAGVQTGAAILGAAAGLAIWVVLVGGATMWARFHRAGVPETQGVALLQREVLAVVGVHVLVVMFVLTLPLTVAVALLSAATVRQVRRTAATGGRAVVSALGSTARSPTGAFAAVLIYAGVVALVLLGFSRWFEIGFWYFAGCIVVAVVALGLVFLASWRLEGRRIALPFAVFAITFAAAGIIGALREFGNAKIRVDHASLVSQGAVDPWQGLFVRRTGDTIYVAGKDQRSIPGNEARDGCRIHAIALDSVRSLNIRNYDEAGDPNLYKCPGGTKLGAPPLSTSPDAPDDRSITVKGTVTVAGDTNDPPPPITVTVQTPPAPPGPPGPRGPTGPRGAPGSINVKDLPPGARLAISRPEYFPGVVHNTGPFVMKVRITTDGDQPVNDVRVYVRSLTTYFAPANGMTGPDGFARICIDPPEDSQLPFGSRARIALFVRAWHDPGSIMAPTSGRRLVRLHLGPRSDREPAGNCPRPSG